MLGVGDAIGMRHARGILGNAAIVGEHGDCFYVPTTRRAQHQPLGLEDRDTARVPPSPAGRSSNRVMAWAPAKKPKGGAGIPVSPFSEPIRVRRCDWMPADLI